MLIGETVVRVEQLRKVYEPSPLWLRFLLRSSIRTPIVALDDVSLELSTGRLCAVLGPNGAGKSTLFRILTGLTTPTAGRASVLGIDTRTRSPHLRRLIGFMPADDRSLFLRHTCRENLEFHGSLHGLRRAALEGSIDEVLERVGLDGAADRVGFALSAGMRARLQLARALLHRPKLLVLDEPTGSVDPMGSYHLLQLIEQIAREDRVSVLLSSHRLEEIEALEDYVVLLDRGRIVHAGPLEGLRQLWERPALHLEFSQRESAAAAASKVRQRFGDDTVDIDGTTLEVTVGVPVGQVLACLDGNLSGVVSIREARPSLREVLAFATSGLGPEQQGKHDAAPRD